ncbi:MAG TPA: IS200/IS605 family transposase [Polyangiaceae bacterium]|nr:IS200/IS605 family transposase [Polyangiaceae bacterium]
MAHSLARLHVHLVFGTKHRAPLIHDGVRDAFHGYVFGTLSKLDCGPVIVNSVEDHVHILFNLNRSMALSKVVEEIKKSSSKWLKVQGQVLSAFGWQNGYGAFAVSEANISAVRRYILKQQEHHKKKTFEAEYKALLVSNGLPFDDHQLWD